MQLNSHIDQTVFVTIRGKKCPVTIAGTGTACLSICQGTLGQRTLSDRFKKIFKVYASDLYFDQQSQLENPTSLTMDQIIDDIVQMAKQLKLSKFVLFGFSSYGIVALELAKKYPDLVAGIIMSGTPPNSNPQTDAFASDYFEKHADQERKRIDAQRAAQFAQKDTSDLNSSDYFIAWYCYRLAPRNFYQADFDCTQVWDGMRTSKTFDYLFSDILPATDVTQNLEKVSCPVFLAAGASDYNSCPFLWADLQNLPARMTIHLFEKSGHWPHWEQSKLFDERIETWAQQNL